MERKVIYRISLEFDKSYTFNSVSRMSKAQQREISRHVRGRAKDKWKQEDRRQTGRVQRRARDVVFRLVPFLSPSATLPDTDAYSWIAKYILDGAVEAHILPNDSGLFIAEVVLARASFDPSLEGSEVLFQAWLSW